MTRNEKLVAASFAVLVFGCVIINLLPPACVIPRPVAQRMQCRHNLKQLGVAMHNYLDAYHCFPPAYATDKTGHPMHSWRVLLLPFIEQPGYTKLYKQYHFDEPWNGPHNRELAAQMPLEYRCPSDEGPQSDASYFVVVGPKTASPGTSPVRIRDITDGTSQTILLVESANSGVNWLEPRDVTYEEALRGINAKDTIAVGISSHHQGGALICFADGFVQFLSNDTPLEKLRLLLERNDGQTVQLSNY